MANVSDPQVFNPDPDTDPDPTLISIRVPDTDTGLGSWIQTLSKKSATFRDLFTF